MVDLHRLSELGRSARDPDLVATPDVPVSEPNNGYCDSVEIVGHDPALLGATKIQTPSPTIELVNEGVQSCPGTRTRGIPASP
jgi:hypothetical protein